MGADISNCCKKEDNQDSELPLPPWAAKMLRNGNMHTAFTLCTVFSPEVTGGTHNKKMPAEGETATIRPPDGVHQASQPTLLRVIGKHMAIAAIWKGDEDKNPNCIWVVTQQATEPFHSRRIITDHDLLPVDEKLWYGQRLEITRFPKQMLEKLWWQYGLRDVIFGEEGLTKKYKDYRWIFCGCSHGSTMAQGISFLFALERSQQRLDAMEYVIDWNGYRWCDKAGQGLLSKYLGDRQAHFVVAYTSKSGELVLETTPGFPASASNAPNMFALDRDTGKITSVESVPDIHTIGLASFEFVQLHSAGKYVQTMKQLTTVYGVEPWGDDATVDTSDTSDSGSS